MIQARRRPFIPAGVSVVVQQSTLTDNDPGQVIELSFSKVITAIPSDLTHFIATATGENPASISFASTTLRLDMNTPVPSLTALQITSWAGFVFAADGVEREALPASYVLSPPP